MTDGMDDDAQATANAAILPFIHRLTEYVRTYYPLHSMALRSEIVGNRLTDSRWNKVAAVLASFHAIPGIGLSPDEHDVRNIALASVVVAQKMAAASFGGRDPVQCREIAREIASEIDDRIKRNGIQGTKDSNATL